MADDEDAEDLDEEDEIEDEDDEDAGDGEPESEAEAEAAEGEGGEEEDYPDPDDLDFGEDGEFDDEDEDDPAVRAARAAKKKKIVLIGGGATVLVLILAMLGLILFAGGGGDGGGDSSAALPESTDTRVSMALPTHKDAKPAPRAGGGLVRPPTLAERAAAMGAKTGADQAPAPPVGTGQGLVIPSVTAASYSAVPGIKRADPLRPAPVRSMAESGPNGLMPKLSPDGRRAWQVYARPFTGDPAKPRIGIIMSKLGLSRASTLAAIEQLPAAVTLSFDPYGSGLDDWVNLARGAGHEVMLGLPLESANYPVFDPGPYALLTDLDRTQNLGRLRSILSLMPGYTGVVIEMGSQFLTSDQALSPVIEELNKRGLMIVETGRVADSRVVPLADQFGMPRAVVDVEIDEVPSRYAIPAKFTELEARARQRGRAIGIAEPLPITIRLLAEWSLNLPGRNIELAPVSALVPPPAAPAQGAQPNGAAPPPKKP